MAFLVGKTSFSKTFYFVFYFNIRQNENELHGLILHESIEIFSLQNTGDHG